MSQPEYIKAAGRGMAVAAGVMVSRGEHGFALEILRAGGIDSEAELRACNVCDYDMKLCLEAIKRG